MIKTEASLDEQAIVAAAERALSDIAAIRTEVSKVIFGQESVVENTLLAVLSGGHALLVGVPGLAKTRLVTTLGEVLGLAANRIQFTPDLMPSDILGSEVMQRLDNTHLAYVVTGEQDVDNISEEGLDGLTKFLTYRTTLEPAPPVGVDLNKDELSFYPIIYWPVSATAPMPSNAAISRIDAYMTSGTIRRKRRVISSVSHRSSATGSRPTEKPVPAAKAASRQRPGAIISMCRSPVPGRIAR